MSNKPNDETIIINLEFIFLAFALKCVYEKHAKNNHKTIKQMYEKLALIWFNED